MDFTALLTGLKEEFDSAQSPRLVVPGFDVDFDVDVKQHLLITDHTNRGFGCNGTAPDDMKHDGTTL